MNDTTTRDLPALANDVRSLATLAAATSLSDVQTALATLDLDSLNAADVRTLAALLTRPTHECKGRTRALACITRMVWAAHESGYSC